MPVREVGGPVSDFCPRNAEGFCQLGLCLYIGGRCPRSFEEADRARRSIIDTIIAQRLADQEPPVVPPNPQRKNRSR